ASAPRDTPRPVRDPTPRAGKGTNAGNIDHHAVPTDAFSDDERTVVAVGVGPETSGVDRR
ncbi:MAG: hypothetical protein WAM97_14485, partial [Acidimicrobiales bacterium]